MKVIEEPAFKLENSMGFDALVEREMETLEGGCFNNCTGQCNSQSGGSGGTTTSSTTTSSTTLAI
jgi:hypothetical protein